MWGAALGSSALRAPHIPTSLRIASWRNGATSEKSGKLTRSNPRSARSPDGTAEIGIQTRATGSSRLMILSHPQLVSTKKFVCPWKRNYPAVPNPRFRSPNPASYVSRNGLRRGTYLQTNMQPMQMLHWQSCANRI